jgi:hypothetical protein
LNTRHRRWLELINDYVLFINYILGKANFVANVLSRKAMCNMLVGRKLPKELQKEIEQTQIELWEGKPIESLEATRNMGEMSMNLKEGIMEKQTKILS